MRNLTVLPALALVALVGAVLAEPPPKEVLLLRMQVKGTGKRVDVSYLYDKDQGHVNPPAQAALRAKEAAKTWENFDKSKPIALIARSPFGGGECSKSYWPAEVKPELLATLVEPLTKAGLKVEMPDRPPTTAPADPTSQPVKPWPSRGFSEDYDFVLLVGLHHEPIPYEGARSSDDGKTTYFRAHRLNAWAILFYAPTATALWGTTAVAGVNHRGVEDPVNQAAETVLSYLDFADIGKDNISGYLEQLTETKELPSVDIAAMLAQTQRADAMQAILKAAMADPAYKTTAWVLRFFNARGTAQDFRIEVAEGKSQGLSLAAQRVKVRLLYMEQLRGMRQLQPCVVAALIPEVEDLDLFKLGQAYAGLLEPLSGDEEIVLIGELAHSDEQQVFGKRGEHMLDAIRNLGKCKVHLEEATAVARFYAERPVPPPVRGRPAYRDPLKEAGQAALTELGRTKEELQKKAAEKAKSILNAQP